MSCFCFCFLVVVERIESCINKEAQVDHRHWPFKGIYHLALWALVSVMNSLDVRYRVMLNWVICSPDLH